jgi:hypothetical protein
MMQLSDKAQIALENVVKRFQSGDLSPVTDIVRLRLQQGETPSRKWSFSNQVLAYGQTGCTDCRGYRQWQQVGRWVKKGAQAAWILAPVTVLVENASGEKVPVLRGFKGVAVFAFEDTEGKPLEKADYQPVGLPPLADVARSLGIAVRWQPMPQGVLGGCDEQGTRITLGTHDPSVFFHELAHAAHARVQGGLSMERYNEQETVAEFTACVLMELYGLGDSSGNAWQYLSGYAAEPLVAIVKALSTVERVLEVLGV